MTSTATLLPPEDPTLAVAERQLAMLSRLASIGMAVCEAQGSAAVAASNAAVAAVSDTAWQCERDRALALAGSKDAAEAFRKGSRTLRLTLMLEKTIAEWLRDLRLGIVRPAKAAGRTRADPAADGASFGSEVAETEKTETEARETECLVEFERSEDLSSFRGAVGRSAKPLPSIRRTDSPKAGGEGKSKTSGNSRDEPNSPTPLAARVDSPDEGEGLGGSRPGPRGDFPNPQDSPIPRRC